MPKIINRLFLKIKRFFRQKILLVISIWVAVTGLMMGIQYLLAYTGPTAPPPGGIFTNTQYLNTGDEPQTKTGSLRIGGIISSEDLIILGKTYGGYMSPTATSSNPAYFYDVWLDKTQTWASSVEIPFNRNCQPVPSGHCFGDDGVVLDTEGNIVCPPPADPCPESADDRKYYAIVGVSSGGVVTCCRPPKAPAPPPQSFPMTETVDVTISVSRCAVGAPVYKGVASIKVINAADGVTPISDAKVYGYWSGATIRCENGNNSGPSNFCPYVTTGSNGEAIINSFDVPAENAYDVGSFTFTVGKITHQLGSSPTDLPKSDTALISDSGEPLNTHVGSVELEADLSTDGYQYQVTATVKIVNEAGFPVPGILVKGVWSGAYIGNTGTYQPVGLTGEITFTTPWFWTWDVPISDQQVTFTVTGVEVGSTNCSEYDSNFNDPLCGCGSVETKYYKYPSVLTWRSYGDHKYAWGENIGWANLQPIDGGIFHGGVLMGTDCLEGYAWAENMGWINFGDGTPQGGGDCDSGKSYLNTTAEDFGVNRNESTGNLYGYAWAENVGWINFGSPTTPRTWGVSLKKIDQTTLQFQGYAWAESVGWINFNHNQTGYISCSCFSSDTCHCP